MSQNIEIKYAYLNGELKLVDANREFFVYFEKPGIDIHFLADFVCPSNYKALEKFVKSPRSAGKTRIFKFPKNMSEARENIVSIYPVTQNGEKLLCLKMIDFEDGLRFFDDYHSEESELFAALSLRNDCVFSYKNDSNTLRIIQFFNSKKMTLYEQDIDEWCSSMIRRCFVQDENIQKLKEFVSELKKCPQKIETDIEGFFRTYNPNVREKLNFIGIRYLNEAEINIVGKIMAFEDASKAETAKRIIEEMQIDPLTKTFNKKRICAYAENLFQEERDANIAFIIIDLDHFKMINDIYGHLAGDRVLEKAGEILREIVGTQGVVGRFGGDEFLVLYADAGAELVLRGVLRSILIRIRNFFAGKFGDVNITCSIGCSVFPKNGSSYEELFKKADWCLYRAKDKGRNRYVFFRDDLHAELYRKAMENVDDGIKCDNREVLELRQMEEFISEVSSNPKDAILKILEHIFLVYKLDNITIYYGENMDAVYSRGMQFPRMENAGYARSADFKSLLERRGKTSFRIDFLTNIPDDMRDLKEEIEARKIKSTVHCILGTVENIKGLVTFNRLREASLWAEYEVNCSTIFSSVLNLLPESALSDFIEFSSKMNKN